MTNLEKKYRNRTLFNCCYKGGRDICHRDIIDENSLMFFLYEVDSHERSITNDGIAYIKERFGIKKVYELIKKDQAEGGDLKFENEEHFVKWLYREPYGQTIEEETIKVKNGSHFTVARFKKNRDDENL